jgi:DnaK suppressor protein
MDPKKLQQLDNYDAQFEKRDSSDTLDEQAQSITEYEERRAEEQLFEMRLKKIKKTRQRIQNGTYGTCVDCDTDIPLGRLTANPVTSRCMPCSEKANLV